MRSPIAMSLCAAFLAIPLSAQSLPFPLAPSGPEATLLEPGAELLEAFRAHDGVVVGPLSLPGGAEIHLELTRIRAPFTETLVYVDGRPTDRRPDGSVTLWRANVLGSPADGGFLAFSAHGSRGWIRSGDVLFHLLAEPGPDGRWSSSRSRWITEDELRALGLAPQIVCAAEEVNPEALFPRTDATSAGEHGDMLSAVTLPILDCRIAVETDYQYYQVFGDLDAATTYLVTLFGAVSDRYREQISTILTAPYMAFYTTSADPWSSQDSGGSCIDVLYEFQAAWQGGGAPVPADLYHLVSGASLGCGVAWLPGLCDQDYGFAVSGNINGGTPFPVAQGPFNWDFIVFAHETGHNFNAPHTHSYCPPIDKCAPSGYFGPCQDSQVCISDGTLMSYCHLCSGGYSNITTYFHQANVDAMRSYAEGSCLQPFKGVLVEDLGYSLAGSGGDPRLEASFGLAPDSLDLEATQAPASDPGALIMSAIGPVFLPIFGGTLVPGLDIVYPVTSSPAGTVSSSFPIAAGIAPAGMFLWAQIWFLDGFNFAATNGVEIELIVP